VSSLGFSRIGRRRIGARSLALPAALAAGLWALQPAPAAAYEPCDGANRVADITADAELRQRIVDAAVGEWRRFGFQVLDLSTSDADADLSPLLGFSPPLGDMPPDLVGLAKGRLMRIGLAENEFDGITAVRTYWSAVTEGAPDGVSVGGAAWSAAFVSWVMCRAGLSEEQFRRRDAHVLYVAAAFREEAQYGDTPLNFYAYVARPAQAPVRPGDLACFSSAGLGFEERRAISLADGWGSHSGQSHCDIIVGFAGEGARVLAIGGNVQQSVTMSVFAARREGANVYLLSQAEWPAARPFYAVMSLRARPDLADRVTIAYARPAS
jgi:hypothetical protein